MILEKMFDRLSNGEKFAWTGINLTAWLSYLHYLYIGWQPLLTLCLTITGTIAGGVGSVIAIDFYKEKLKHKLYKHKKDTKAKDGIEEKEKTGNP